MAKQITVIPAKQVRINSTKNEEVSSKVKVAAYCRA